MKRIVIIGAYIIGFLFLFSCNREKKVEKWKDTAVSGVVPVVCDQCFQPIVQEMIDVFESIYLQAGIAPIFTDELRSIELLIQDSVRCAVVSRTLSEAEKATFASKKMVVRELKIAQDAIALIVNKNNPERLMSMETLRKILIGEITDWSQINAKSTLGKIDLMFDHRNSSTVRYAIDSICKDQPLSEKLYAQLNNQEVVNRVSSMPNAMGVIGVNWISNNKDTTQLSFIKDIQVLAVSPYPDPNVDNSYYPFQYEIALKNYPMIRDVYILLSDPRSGLSTGFTSFVTSDRGQRIITKSGILPATQPINIVNIRNKPLGQ